MFFALKIPLHSNSNSTKTIHRQSPLPIYIYNIYKNTERAKSVAGSQSSPPSKISISPGAA